MAHADKTKVPQTLLLADDSVTIQRVIELTFADEDIEVVAVSDGEQAIARLDAIAARHRAGRRRHARARRLRGGRVHQAVAAAGAHSGGAADRRVRAGRRGQGRRGRLRRRAGQAVRAAARDRPGEGAARREPRRADRLDASRLGVAPAAVDAPPERRSRVDRRLLRPARRGVRRTCRSRPGQRGRRGSADEIDWFGAEARRSAPMAEPDCRCVSRARAGSVPSSRRRRPSASGPRRRCRALAAARRRVRRAARSRAGKPPSTPGRRAACRPAARASAGPRHAPTQPRGP